MKRTPYDKAVSDVVRERADWACEKCGVISEEGRNRAADKGMQCSHYYGRKHNSTRYDMDNCFCLCASCHSWLEDRPADHRVFVISKLGEARHDELMRRHHQVKKYKSWMLKELKEHYRAEFERIRERHFSGERGYIEVINYD